MDYNAKIVKIKKTVDDKECSSCGNIGQVVELGFNTQRLCSNCVANYFNVRDSKRYSRCFELDAYEKRNNNDRN